MKTKNLVFILFLALTIFSCGPKRQYEAKEKALKDSISNEEILSDSISGASTYKAVSSSAAVEKGKDSTRKFIRTADLKFKVKNVIKSTYNIEDIAIKHGGFVTYTNLSSNIGNVRTSAVSADSSLETTYYTVINSITIRVPNVKLDTTLKDISKLIVFLDYRTIKANDVAFQILANNLTQKRIAGNQNRIVNAIVNKRSRLNETAAAEDALLNKQEQADNAKISNLTLKDQIQFSTINLFLYQRESIVREVISNNKNIKAYEPGFGKSMLESLIFGWDIFAALILFIIRLWAIILFGIIAFFAIKILVKKSKK
ncbi:MAG: DUF4349 domain-containing protein [Bacteroidetes bacterium]|nr:DUF4349 domain-containing protein [Bacteroidota bacterium]